LSTPTAAEQRKTAWEGPQYRLACQTQVLADVSVVTNPRKVYGWANHDTYEWLKKQKY
jgi:ferredoxin